MPFVSAFQIFSPMLYNLNDLKQFLLIFFAVIYFIIIIFSLTLLNKLGNFISCSFQHLSFDLNLSFRQSLSKRRLLVIALFTLLLKQGTMVLLDNFFIWIRA